MQAAIDDTIFNLEYADSISPLSRAAAAGDLDQIKKLLKCGKLPQNADNRGWTSIHYCVISNQVKALKLILKLKSKNTKYLVNLTTWDNVTPLLLALKVRSPSLEMVKTLLKAGALPQISTFTKLSPLHLACLRKGNIDFVKLLVQYGANVNAKEDIKNFTPLHLAVSEANDQEVIKYLVNICDLRIKNSEGRTAFMEACFSNSIEIIRLFLEVDRTLVREESDILPLALAGYLGNFEMADLLIKYGADMNARCKAVISNVLNESEGIVLNENNYLPIYSSLKNLKVFQLFLKFTNPLKILELDSDFPTFVLIHCQDVVFFETLLQSHFPLELRQIRCTSLINLILNTPLDRSLTLKKFQICFKYNFYLEPDDVFQSFMCLMSREELVKNIKFLHILAQMGVSSGDQYSNKKSAIDILDGISNENKESEESEAVRLICHRLSQSVLTLQQLCRIIVRRYVKNIAENDLLALRMIQESDLPERLKEYILFVRL